MECIKTTQLHIFNTNTSILCKTSMVILQSMTNCDAQITQHELSRLAMANAWHDKEQEQIAAGDKLKH